MAIRDLIARLFGHTEPAAEGELPPHLVALLPEAVDLVVNTVEPKLRYARGYPDRLEAAVRCTMVFLHDLATDLPDPIELCTANWASDPRLNAFFASRDDIAAVMARSTELRAFFDEVGNVGAEQAVAVLAMQRVERTVLGVALEGDTLRQDVPQTSVSFSDPRIVIPAHNLAALRFELGSRTFRRLLNVALERIEAIHQRGRRLSDRKALLDTKLRRLEARRGGLESLAENPDAHAAEIEALEGEFQQTKADLAANRSTLATLEDYLEQVTDVLTHPEQHIKQVKTPLRLNRMGVKVKGDSDEPVNEITVTEVSVGPNVWRTIAVVQCARTDLPAKEDLLARAERYL